MQRSFRKHNLKLGVFLSYREASEGGGFTITEDILNSILSKYTNKKIIFITLNDHKNILKKKIQKAGFECHSFYESEYLIKLKNFIFSIFPFLLRIYNKFYFNNFLNFEKEKQIDVVWFISAEYYFPLFSKYISTVWDLQHLTHSHFPESGSFLRRLYREFVIKNFLRNSHKIITGSKILIKLIIKHYDLSVDKFIYNNHPTPRVFINSKKRLKKKYKYKNYFLYPANFWQHKNHLNLFEGFKKFNKKYKNKYKLILVGDVKDKKFYKSLKNKFHKDFDKNFIILNFVKLEFLIQLYDNCLALIYSSFAGPENLPPLEAMARKKNIICSNYPGAKEQLKDIPIYFNPNNSDSIKSALEKFIQRKIKKNFFIRNTDKYVSKVLNVINYD
jgi:glycosyltransferase involved in cell wall biosynthesis